MDVSEFVYLFTSDAIFGYYEHLCIGLCVFSSPREIPGSGTAVLSDKGMSNFIRKWQTIFQSECNIYIPMVSVCKFQFLHVLPTLCYYQSFQF